MIQQMTSLIAIGPAKTDSSQSMARTGRTLAVALVAMVLGSIAAHAQGTVDLSGVTTAMSAVQKTCALGGAIAVVIGIIFGVFQFMGRNMAGGFLAIAAGLFAGIVIGFAPTWVSSLTGQTLSIVVVHAAGGLA